MPNRYRLLGFSLFIALFFISLSSFSGENPEEGDHKDGHLEQEEKFAPGDFIMHHIMDAHEWHIIDIDDHSVSIPLPIILWTENGVAFFMSSEFHHDQEAKVVVETSAGKFVNLHGKIYYASDTPNEHGQYIEMDKEHVVKNEKPLDFSITKNVLSLFISLILICWIFFTIAKKYKKRQGMAPKGLQSLLEPLIIFIRDDVAKASIGEKKYMKFLPFLLTVFFFIFINNLLGLVPLFPGGANLTGNIAVTLILALFTFILTTINGNKGYWMHIVNAPGVPWWLKFPVPLMPIVEVIGVFTKPFVLMVRLFANITAGHIIAMGFFSLIFIFGDLYGIWGGVGLSPLSVAFTIFMTLLELLVAFIQAYVFTLLSALYFGMAVDDHH